MANRSIPCTTTMLLTLLATVPGTLAQSPERVKTADAISGIRTDRLTSKQLRVWREIEKIAEAADKTGRPLHPRLHSLWQWAKDNGHTITIEMAERKDHTRIGGRVTPEQVDSNGVSRAAILWLHLSAIDNALVDPVFRRSNGLIPYDRLGKYERYAEAVGHELTHAFLILENPEYASLCSEVLKEAAEFRLALHRRGNGAALDEATRQQGVRVQSMCSRIERPAEAAELEIWRELLNGRRGENGAGAGMVPRLDSYALRYVERQLISGIV